MNDMVRFPTKGKKLSFSSSISVSVFGKVRELGTIGISYAYETMIIY